MAARLARQLHATHEIKDVKLTGILGLVRAACTYDATKGTERFWAWSCIRLEILSAYAHGLHQHSGSDAFTWATCRRPLSDAQHLPAPESEPEPAPLPTFDNLTPSQQLLLKLVYEDGLSEHAIARRHLLGSARHTQSKREVGIGWRRVSAEHQTTLKLVREWLSSRSTA